MEVIATRVAEARAAVEAVATEPLAIQSVKVMAAAASRQTPRLNWSRRGLSQARTASRARRYRRPPQAICAHPAACHAARPKPISSPQAPARSPGVGRACGRRDGPLCARGTCCARWRPKKAYTWGAGHAVAPSSKLSTPWPWPWRCAKRCKASQSKTYLNSTEIVQKVCEVWTGKSMGAGESIQIYLALKTLIELVSWGAAPYSGSAVTRVLIDTPGV